MQVYVHEKETSSDGSNAPLSRTPFIGIPRPDGTLEERNSVAHYAAR